MSVVAPGQIIVKCLQDDLLYESLTVWETLYFAAMLRLPRDFTTEQKKQRVAKVIAALGLNRCKDTIIGTVTHSLQIAVDAGCSWFGPCRDWWHLLCRNV